MSWITCVVNSAYEIRNSFPYQIRKKSNGRIISECIGNDGYVQCALNRKKYLKHVIVAKQWLVNNDPVNKTEVDHVNHDRTDFHITNLRWVTRSQNQRNQTGNNGYVYEYVDEIPDNAIEINEYGNSNFEFYYFVEEDNSFYYYNGIRYRKIQIKYTKSGSAFINARNTDNKQIRIYLNKFKKLYELM